MLKYCAVLFLLMFCLKSFGQTMQGVVLDKATQQPIPGALIALRNWHTITNNDGIFELKNIGVNDTLKVTSLGFATEVLPLAGLKNYMRIMLSAKRTVLTQVDIAGKRSYSQDSAQNRKAFSKQFNYKAPRLSDAIVASPSGNPDQMAGINPLAIIAALGKKNNNAYKLQQHLVTDERENFINSRFNSSVVQATVPTAHGDTLTTFLTWYRPGYDFAKKASAYEMLMYIRNSYQHFTAAGFKYDARPPLKPLDDDKTGKKVDLSNNN